MPLESTTLQGNTALQACLVRDEAHVTPGARGDHVGLIHKCLLVLEPTPIAANEIRSKAYGPSTAAAVLAYKRRRQIINSSYQTQADNIVGKMTIARLDKDIAKVERSRTFLDRCPQSGGGGRILSLAGVSRTTASLATSPTVAAPGGPPPPVNLGRTLAIHLQRTDGFTAGAELFALALLARARELLRPHGLTLVDSPGPGIVGLPVPWPDLLVHTQFPADRFAVRKAAVNTTPGNPKVLRVILCPFDPADDIRGITDGGRLTDVDESLPMFCLINTTRKNPDQGTLLHEMIHASFLGASPPHDGDAQSVYSIETARTRLSNAHAKKLSEAFFAR